jgi:hypothetical protein
MDLILAVLFATILYPDLPQFGFMISVGSANDVLDLVQAYGKMKVAGASTVRGSKMRDHL